MSVVDEKQLAISDLKNNNKKKRFGLRYEVENHYRNKSLSDSEKKEALLKNKFSYKRYQHIDNRQFNILNTNDQEKDYKNIVSTKDSKSNWDILVGKSNKNNTFISKPLYKDQYDCTEVNKNAKEFFLKRKGNYIIYSRKIEFIT